MDQDVVTDLNLLLKRVQTRRRLNSLVVDDRRLVRNRDHPRRRGKAHEYITGGDYTEGNHAPPLTAMPTLIAHRLISFASLR